jgi:hypothetical protein
MKNIAHCFDPDNGGGVDDNIIWTIDAYLHVSAQQIELWETTRKKLFLYHQVIGDTKQDNNRSLKAR